MKAPGLESLCSHAVRWMPDLIHGLDTWSCYTFWARSNLLFEKSLFLIHNFVPCRGVVLTPLVARTTRRGGFPSTPTERLWESTALWQQGQDGLKNESCLVCKRNSLPPKGHFATELSCPRGTTTHENRPALCP